MKRLFAALVLVCGALIVTPVLADTGFRLELGAGMAMHKKRMDGLWYQQEYPNSHKLTPFAWQAGASWFTTGTPWRIGLRGAYVNLGQVSSDALAIEYEYDRGKEMPCVPETLRGNCFAQFTQQTTNKGWSVGPVLEYDLGNRLSVSAEAGAFFGQQKVHGHVVPITIKDQAEIDVVNKWTYTSYYAGGGVRYGHWSLNLRHYGNLARTGGVMGPRTAYTIMLGYTYEF